MYRLRVLGSLDLQAGSGADVPALLAQPKRIALLTFLALTSRNGAVRRDTVLALFWPELDTEHARHALRQSLYHLRRELGAAVIVGNGDDQLCIDPDVLHCDAVAFTDALRSGSFERALELYRGELLPGLHVHGSAELEQWLDSARARLGNQALDAAGRLCAAAQGDGRMSDAVHWARRAHELAGYDEGVLRRLLEVLEIAGNGGAAVLAYDAFVDRCERDLGVAPAAETVAIIDRIRARAPPPRRRRGQRAAPPPVPLAAAAAPARWRRTLTWPGAVLLVLLLGGTFVATRRGQPTPLDSELIAIPPFRAIGASGDAAFLADAVSTLLAAALQTERGPRTADAFVTAARFRSALQQGRGDERRDIARDVARSLGAGRVLYGTVLARGAVITLQASLEEVNGRTVVASETVQGDSTQLLALVSDLAIRIFGATIGEDRLRLQRLTSSSPAAVRAYLEGRAAARRGAYADALRLLNDALEIDTAFAAAALALVDVTGWAGRAADQPRYERIAYRHRDRLGALDQLHLYAWMGDPQKQDGVGAVQLLRATEEAFSRMPDRPELLFLLGDRYFHLGDMLQVDDAARRSRTLMERALELDSLAAAREHLVELAILTDDPAAVRRYRELIVRHEPDAARTPYIRWLAAHYLDEKPEQVRMRAALDTMNPVALRLIRRAVTSFTIGVDDSERAARVLKARAVTPADVLAARQALGAILRQRGRYAAADSVIPPVDVSAMTPAQPLANAIALALYSDAPPAGAHAAAAELARRALLPAYGAPERFDLMRAVFGAELWKLRHGDTLTAGAALERLRALSPFSTGDSTAALTFRIAILEAIFEHARTPATTLHRRPALERLDSLARTGAVGNIELTNVVLVTLFEEAGMPWRALAAARRRMSDAIQPWLPGLLAAEARLAEATGDGDAAVHACRRYLALRTHPDPSARPQADSVRARYERLLNVRNTAAPARTARRR